MSRCSVAARTAAVAVAFAGVACAKKGPDPAFARPPTASEWTLVRRALASARASEKTTAYVEDITVAMREPRTGHVFQARGAVAVDPRRAMRMILVGPGGGTALDVWVTDDKWRLVVPALDLRKKGGRDPASARGLPVGFFRWWMLHPLDGRLLAGWMRDGDPVFLLRREGETVLLRDHAMPGGHHLLAIRRASGDVDELESIGHGHAPGAGDKARYVQRASGLEVEVLVEGVSDEPPDPAAFLDPDTLEPAGGAGGASGKGADL